jgi:hypothetical protein
MHADANTTSSDDVLLFLCDPDDASLFEAAPSDTNTSSDQNPFDKSFKKANMCSIKKANSRPRASPLLLYLSI